MRNISHKSFGLHASAAIMASVLIGSVFYLSAPKPAHAIYCSNCATWYHQMREYAEAVSTNLNTAKQLQTQISQYNDMVKQGMSLPSRNFKNITRDLENIADVYRGTQAIGRNISNLEEAFKQQFPGYQTYLQSSSRASEMMPSRYEKWDRQGQDNARTAMLSAGMNISTFASEEAQLRTLVSRSQNAEGRLQAIQAGNEIAASNVQQLQKLRDLLATQIQMQSNYMAQEQERMSIENALQQQRSSMIINDTGLDKGY
ncbi:P-type conjugative transfer protein TrbJ [Comamonas endophytica]|uniref:P-type conjugative transfer protein TrbJ n=1 Tax=Comamonas endophytica TaxID=2949090 RepID=A0ABY6GGN4_9BURK|nr:MULTISPECIES: P-type conjugative transfer protein TrbJ [unclassified Acidovorax]MCD2514657.1 P-type conjugative transfer protein TrbJ [Acidovorax sp. D4N7]UYG53969.1 P-type conjugative transfer protein TrbJ [Acidovorax sp. 5MLIR]UYG54008.1 P-type conjugative transfer protein TrbJ [Acidovorax sp. 5MLIR]